MKVVREKEDEKRTITIRLSSEVMARLDEVAEANDVSRQRLIEAILQQVLADKHFIVRI